MKSILPTHHAIFAEGNISDVLAFFRKGLEERGIELLGNPDVIFLHYDSLGIAEARELVEISLTAPVKEKKKIIVLTFDGITREAQNALLKLFEDPNPSVEFLIASQNANSLLPTLRSRLFVMKLEGKADKGNSEIKKFLSLAIGEKMKEVEKMFKKYKEVGDKRPIREFLLSVHLELEKNPEKNAEALRASAKSLSYVDDKSASMKLLLESIVLAL